MSALPQIGFVGLGNMGGPMCQRLLKAGYPVAAFDLNQAALDRAVASGAVAAASAADCAARADVFMTSLPRPDHVEAVMSGESGALRSLKAGSLWIDLTTNRKELIFDLAKAAPEGVSVVDSPVTGAVDGARNGKLTLFAGGDQASFDRALPILRHLGKVVHCGGLGTGNVVELGTLWHAIRNSVGDSFVADHDAPSIFAGHYDPSFSLDLCLKDLRLIQELNRNVRAALPMTTAAEGAFALAATRYGSQAAELHVARRIEDDAGISMRLEGDWLPHWEK